MLFNDPYRHDILRKYTLVFGALFNEIQLQHLHANGDVAQVIKVPLTYAPKEKVLARVLADPSIDRQAAAILPRMSFELTSMTYDGSRKLRSVGRNSVRTSANNDTLFSMLNPVPYDLKYTLWVFTKYVDDGNQIVEQIVPYFTPHFAATINLIEPDVNVDCHFRLDSVVCQDLYVGQFSDRRGVMWTLEFSADAYIFGRVRESPVIKFANATFFVPNTNTASQGVGSNTAIDRVTVQPGMDANGDPTPNVQITVDYSSIDANDDWTYAVTTSGSLVPGDIGGDEGES